MDEFAEINITPFTDVLLVLLIIFIMLAALIVPTGFEKKLDSGKGGKTAVVTPTSNLIIGRSGVMSLDGKQVDERSIYPALVALHARHTNISLAISGDYKVPYRLVIRAMDAAKAASIDHVNFVTQ